jgi:hypothetical protein
MNKRSAIKAALCVIAAIASTSVFAELFWPNTAERPPNNVCQGEPSDAPLHATTQPDDLEPPPGTVFVPADKVDREGKAPPSEIKLNITLTMRRPRLARGGRHAHRNCR